MRHWLLLYLLCSLAAPVCAALDIIDLPSALGDSYDFTWEMHLQAPITSSLLVGVEQTAGGEGYQLRMTNDQVSWEFVDAPGVPLSKTALTLPVGKPCILTIKRRPDTMALLINHRLLLCTPAPVLGRGTLAFRHVPTEVTIDSARYRAISRIAFGDDFMRPDSMTSLLVNPKSWVEDDTWKVAYYRKDNPGADPRDPKTGAAMVTPWQLSIYNPLTSSNGFWFLYWGAGPSWVVANPTMSFPSWDAYFIEAAVRTEYDGEVGIIAAYQDNKNYLLFRWRQRDYTTSDRPKAELVAFIDGEAKILAASTQGFDPMQWYQLRINLGWKQVQALVDGRVLLEARNPGAIEGRVGLYANGALAPRRPKVDDVTASMYLVTDEKGRTVNEAADAMRSNSLLLFNNVRVGSWLSAPNLLNGSAYPLERRGRWETVDDTLLAHSAGALLGGPTQWSHYVVTSRVQIPQNGSAGIYFHLNHEGDGYLWLLSPSDQQLLTVAKYTPQQPVERCASGLAPGKWGELRVEADGPYVTVYLNQQRVMEHYDASCIAGRCGVYAPTRGVRCSTLSVSQMELKHHRKTIIDSFSKDKWLVTWSSAEADWYPGFPPRALITPSGLPHSLIGAAAPLPTDQPGTYWHKGGHYHDLRVTIPVTLDQLAKQTLHLAANYDETGGYRLLLDKENGQGVATLQREAETIGVYHFPMAANAQLLFERRGSYLLCTAQELDPEGSAEEPIVAKEHSVFVYKDPTPLKTSMVGFTVTTVNLPAARVQVESDRVEDTFQTAPSGWLAQSGVWAVMARYSCQPQWNWFGGFGVNTPTVWSKYRLDGDQTVEAYLGVKMQYDNQPEEEGRRFRDLGVTICADGAHLNSGYTFLRVARIAGQPTSVLLRKGEVVKTSSKPEDLLPSKDQGHREWFATRLEKRGGEIQVYLDNHLAMTYVDPDPLPGGYMAIWTLNNGIMIGRANYSAEKMTLGTPHAAAPLAVQETLPPCTMPAVSLNGASLPVCTFASDLDGWQECPGISARLLREHSNDPAHSPDICLKVINMYPAGDFSVKASATIRDLALTPSLQMDYCFDPGAQLNLYVRKDDTWYEFLLTGKPAQQGDIFNTAALHGVADGNWHHLAVDLGAALHGAIIKRHGTVPDNLNIQEMVFADWSSSLDIRPYGFGNNPGGLAARFANFTLVPVVKNVAELQWTAEKGQTEWRIGVDDNPMGAPTATIEKTKMTVPYKPGLRFFHLQGKDSAGNWEPIVHIPLLASDVPITHAFTPDL